MLGEKQKPNYETINDETVSVFPEEIQSIGLGGQPDWPTQIAKIAQSVEHDVANVRVASSNLVFRSHAMMV